MPRRCLVLTLAAAVLAGCTDEGQGSLTLTGRGVVIPWWILLLIAAAVAWLVRRQR